LTALAWAALISLAIVVAAHRLRALTIDGAVAAFLVGLACLGAGGFAVGAPLLTFFVTGSALSRMRLPRAAADLMEQAKGAARDAAQVFANGGAAAVCAVAAGALSLHSSALALPWYAASVGSLAVAAADTWATEVGTRSAAMPRSIAGWKPVAVGASGGVTLFGFAASIAGGAVVGAAAAAFLPGMRFAAWSATCAAIGFVGALIDSVLGATLQGAWYCDGCELPCESEHHRCGKKARFARGLRWLDNDGVNAASTIAGAALGYLFHPLAG
jgi:uncharacterized protein (TIGR00297 family)